jgi:hypothetical protein
MDAVESIQIMKACAVEMFKHKHNTCVRTHVTLQVSREAPLCDF